MDTSFSTEIRDPFNYKNRDICNNRAAGEVTIERTVDAAASRVAVWKYSGIQDTSFPALF